MDDTDILMLAAERGYTCALTSGLGEGGAFDVDGYKLEKNTKIGGVRFKVEIEIDLYFKSYKDPRISYIMGKRNVKKIKDGGEIILGEITNVVEADLKSFVEKGYRRSK